MMVAPGSDPLQLTGKNDSTVVTPWPPPFDIRSDIYVPELPTRRAAVAATERAVAMNKADYLGELRGALHVAVGVTGA